MFKWHRGLGDLVPRGDSLGVHAFRRSRDTAWRIYLIAGRRIRECENTCTVVTRQFSFEMGYFLLRGGVSPPHWERIEVL